MGHLGLSRDDLYLTVIKNDKHVYTFLSVSIMLHDVCPERLVNYCSGESQASKCQTRHSFVISTDICTHLSLITSQMTPASAVTVDYRCYLTITESSQVCACIVYI